MNSSESIGIWAGVLTLALLVFVLVIVVFYLLSLARALKLAGPQNRKMAPGLVWLNLIPIFNLGWMIYTVLKVSEAIASRHAENGTPDPSEGAKTIGLLYTVFALLSFIPLFGALLGLASIVLWIIYWVKVADYNRVMLQMGTASAGEVS